MNEATQQPSPKPDLSLSSAFAIARLGAFEWNLRTDAVTLDNRAREIFGFGPHESPTASEVFGRIAATDLPGVQAEVERARNAVARLDTEYRLRLPDGTGRVVRSVSEMTPGADGKAERATGVFEDVTERRATERRSQASESRLRGLLDGMAEAFVLLDRDFRIVDLNAEALRLENRLREAVVGKTHWEAHPDAAPEVGDLYRQAMAERMPVRLEHRYVWPDGRDTWIDMRAYPTADGSLGVFYRDVTDRKAVETRLTESEERLRLATENAEIGFWDVDLVNDALIWPARVKAMFGISPDAPVTMQDFYQGLHPQDATATAEAFAAASDPARRELYDVEYRTIGKQDGIVRWVAAKGRGIFDAAGRCVRVIGTAVDITPRKRIEARSLALVELGERIRQITDPAELAFEAAAILGRTLGVSRAGYGTIDTSAETISIERDWNAPGIQSLAGLLRFRDYGSYIEDLTSGRTVAIADARLDPRTADTAGALEAISARSFVNMPLTEHGGFVALLYLNHEAARDWPDDELAFVREVAERTRTATARLTAERELRKGRDRLQEESQALEILNRIGTQVAAELNLEALVQSVVAAGVTLTGARFGAFFYNVLTEAGASYMLFALAGAERSAFEGFGMPRATSVFGPTFRGEAVVRSDDILKDERYGKNAPHRGMPKGHLPVRSYLAVPVISRSGEVIGGLLFGHDQPSRFGERSERLMTALAAQAAIGIDNARLFEAEQKANAELEERVRARTAALEQAHEALRQSQKMEAVGQLTGGIAHDFNNMLAVVIGSLDLLRRRMDTADARSRRYVDAAADGARRAALLTQRLLAFSRQQPLRPEPIDANKLVAGMSELIRGSLGSDIRLETVLAAGLWRTHTDPNQLENALLNLAVNARDAMPDGGRLTIETQNAHFDDRYVAAHLGLQTGQYVLVAVTDTGSGMPAEVIARAFDPFFTTKEIGKGTGLGLSQVYGFVKQSGGHVKIYSEAGQGTTVKIYLPRLVGGEHAAGVEETPAELPNGDAQEVVLVVEDEAAVRQFSVDALSELGYRVLEAEGAATALGLLDSHPEIALLFTDVVMPDVNGVKLAEEGCRRRPDLRVLFTTGYTRNAVVHNGVLDAGVALVGKPFTIEELAAKVREVLDRPSRVRSRP